MPSLLGPAPATVRASELPDLTDLTGSKAATITDLFAKRSTDEAIDRTWPSFGVGSTPMTNGGAEAGGRTGILGVTGDGETGPGDADDEPVEASDAPDHDEAARAETDTTPDDSATDDPTQDDGPDATQHDDPLATTDFAYSGALEAPVFEWPSAPNGSGTDADSAEGDVLTAAAMTTTIVVDPVEDADGDASEVSQPPAPAHPEVATEPTTETPETQGETHPAPFLVSAASSAVDYADAPLAPIIDLRNAAGSSGAEIDEAISSGEVEVVAALIEQGMLSTDGPISDRDVRTMVYVAFTSNELRKLLAAGGSPDSPNPGIDLGPVELFKDGLVQPPKTLYAGPPVETEARSQLG